MPPNYKEPLDHPSDENGYSEWDGIQVPYMKKQEVLFDGYFYDVTSFIDRHPGGSVIEYYTVGGEDATLPILQFHNRSIDKVKKIMAILPKRKAAEEEMNFGGDKESRETYRAMTEDIIELHKAADAEGLFKPVYWYNILVVVEVTLLILFGTWIVSSYPSILMKLLGAVIVGIGMGRMGLLQHECGHNSVSGIPKVDKILQNVFYGFYMGMSAKWWVQRHSRHHAMPQRYQRDFDMEHLPLEAVHEDFVKDPDNIMENNFFTRNQGIVKPISGAMFICAINFYYHPHYIIKRRYWDELIALTMHFGLGIYFMGLWPYLLSKYLMGAFLSTSFALNHVHLPVTHTYKHWLEFSLTHTANVTHNMFNDWWLILLNYQIEHHIFPTMPQYNLRFVVERVKKMAAKYNLPYDITSLPQAYRNTAHHLHSVQDHVRKIHSANKKKPSSS